MFEGQQSRTYEFDVEDDTEVVDVEEAPPEIAIGRVATKDLIMHVMDERGQWHRLHPSTTKTACGFPINFYRSVPRDNRRLEHPLATVRPDGEPCDCWTRAERKEADDDELLTQKRREDFEREAAERERIVQKRRDEFSGGQPRPRRDSERKTKP